MTLFLFIFGIIILLIVAFVFRQFYNNTYWTEKDQVELKKLGVEEKQIELPNGNIINYGELSNENPALLLIHGQMVAWQDYTCVLRDLSKKWHVYAIDVYGHGKSSHDESLYYIDTNGNDLIWFIKNVIREKTLVCGHSNGALTAAYIASRCESQLIGVLLEDPPVFSTEGDDWEKSFAYMDSIKTIHEYDNSEYWPVFYLRHCYWGKIFMEKSIDKIANYAQKYHEKHPNEELKIFFLPKSITCLFHYFDNYDLKYGEHFFDFSWNHGIKQEDIFKNIKIPCVYIHAKENLDKNGIYLCAASRAQAERAIECIGDNCKFIETNDSNHSIHSAHKIEYINAVNSFIKYV